MSEPRYEAPSPGLRPGEPPSPAPQPTAPAPVAKSLLDQLQELLASVNADLADLAGQGAEPGPALGSALGAQNADFAAALEPSGALAADRPGSAEAPCDLRVGDR
ncbi:hypothetical protein OG500_25785 [Kitasatospora sp. NBC_01250]|uniref:hypothetical protein n=1 Tax=Kitasatospora sp. NBC_01250 TaxID=2903571 RepID=UPI002E37DAF3|nr:hypothetical protein [Kitasatospora sp. NBC_01250]